ncbi:MAG TPA: hypothetical protein VFG45_05660 [Candidatus Nitrosocosmicus sp.]|nr:hypothetical protein [Candidatus Nitrosocosmicus sp.]
MYIGVKLFRNPELGVIFEYPADWKSVENCRMLYGIDLILYKDYTNFGIVRLSEEELKAHTNNLFANQMWHISKGHKNIPNSEQDFHYHPLAMALKSCIQRDEVIIEDVVLNKHGINNKPIGSRVDSATMSVCILDKRSGYNLIHERTLLVFERSKNGRNNLMCFLIAYGDLHENFESKKRQRQLEAIFDSFRFI